MPDDNDFKVQDYDRIIDNIMEKFFEQHEQHDLNYDYKELVKAQLLGTEQPVEGGQQW